MSWQAEAPRPSWGWAIGFVACLYLLTAAGTWVGGDHAEMILMSHRLVERGTFTLAPEGRRAEELRWAPSGRPRFFPGTPVALAPLVAADRLLGWGAPPELGRLVHLAPPLFVLCALALVGGAARRAGASARAAALLVLLLGTSWPLWQIARRGGAEPVVGLLVALAVWGTVTGSHAARVAASVLLPWTHPTGFLLGPTLALCQPFQPAPREPPGSGAARWTGPIAYACLSLASVASVLLVWNFLYLGNVVSGGYSGAMATAWFSQPPLKEWLSRYLSQCALFVPVPMLASASALALGRRGWRLLVPPVALFLVISTFWSLFTPTLGQDYVRRLSVVWLPFGLAIGLAWERLELSATATAGLLALNLLIGVYWFQLLEFYYYPRPGGLYLPLVVWITWLLDGRPPLLCAGYVLSLALLAGFAAWRLCGVLAPARPA